MSIDPAAAALFPFPSDDPAVVGAAAARSASAAGSAARWAAAVRRCAATVHPHWRSGDGTAAVAELDRLAALGDRGRAALSAAAAALRDYERALLQARQDLTRLRVSYAGAVFDQACAPTEAAQLRARQQAVGDEVRVAAFRAARTLQEGTSALGVVGRSGRRVGAVRRLLAGLLPLWGAEAARTAAAGAARAIGRRPTARPGDLVALMHPYAAWLDDPLFAATLLRRVGVTGFRALLIRVLPGGADPAIASTRQAVYHLLGTVLAAGSRDPALLPGRWLRGLTAGIGDTSVGTPPDTWQLRRSLGLVLCHGRYGGAALEVLVPPILHAADDLGDRSVEHDVDDPVVGAMRALATDPVAAQRLLGRKRVLDTLLDRVWAQDAGRAFGAALAASGLVRTGAGVHLTQLLVHVLGGRSEVPPGLATGLGQLLGRYVEDVNQGLIARSHNRAQEVDEPPPVIGPGPHAHFGNRDVARALYFAMHSAAGSAAVYAHQAAYAVSMIAAPAARHALPRALDALSENYGRLNHLHNAGVVHQAGLDNATAEDDLHNRSVWIDLGTRAVGLLPLPEVGAFAGMLLGGAKGYGVEWGAQWLQRRYYQRPVADDLADRLYHAGGLSRAEETQSRLFVQALNVRAGGQDGVPGTTPCTAHTISEAFQSGQQSARNYLRPRTAVHRGR